MRDPLDNWLRSTPLLSRLCTQNGWVDSDSIEYEIRSNDPDRLHINVHFSEIVMEGAGCVADRVACFGRIEIRLDQNGEVADARLL